MSARKRIAPSLDQDEDTPARKLKNFESVGTQIIEMTSSDTMSQMQITLQRLLEQANEKAGTLQEQAAALGLSFQGETKVTCTSCEEHTMDPTGAFVHNCVSCEAIVCKECIGECDQCDKLECLECIESCHCCGMKLLCSRCSSENQCANCGEGTCSDCLTHVGMYGTDWCAECRDNVLLDREY